MCSGDDQTCPQFELHRQKLLEDLDGERRSFLKSAFVAGGGEKCHQGTETKSKQSNFSARFFQLDGSAYRFHDIPRTRVAIKRRI